MPDIQEEMEIIHRRSQLMVARAPIARIAIADPNVVDVVQYSPNEIGIIGMNLGTTTLTMWFDNSRDPLIYLIEVIPDPTFEDRLRNDFGKLEKQLRILFPNSKVFLVPLQRRLIVKGQARDVEEAARILQIVRASYYAAFGNYGGFGGAGSGGFGGFGGAGGGGFGDINNGNNNGINNGNNNNNPIVDLLEVPGNRQIMIHVTVAELSRGQLRTLGVDLDGLINNGRHFLSSSLGGAGGALTGVFENGEVNLMINWLAGNRTAKILASPTLTVLSGYQASFLSGGEFPVPTIVGVGGAQGTSTSFRGFGTSLLVRPQVVDKDYIQMNITPEYSQISATGSSGGVPGLNSRRVTTTVRLREGQTIVLAGLFGMTMTSEVNRIPFLGELPVIGPALFNSKNADQGENELLITVTPELVHPMEADEVPPYPGFYVTPPNDIELYAYAKSEGYPDQGVYQLNPYGWGPGYANEIGYRPFNPGTFGNPMPMGGGMGNYQVSPPGYGGGFQANPGAVYPGPPAAPQQSVQQFPVQPMQQSPPTGAIQPMADPNLGQPVQQMGGIQQVGYQEPTQRMKLANWFQGNRDSSQRNPALRSTNATTPSLLNGTDSRLGRESQAVQQQRQQQQQMIQQRSQQYTR
ncbi:MAG: pilus assembly protein N-terminal domain-containing protein [Rhodopirellula sp.]|nr:pilus assembly protein N-terminal domain-containing protein [Rhodopirellula sp.]